MATRKCAEKCEWCKLNCTYKRFHAAGKKHNCGNHPDHPLENLNFK